MSFVEGILNVFGNVLNLFKGPLALVILVLVVVIAVVGFYLYSEINPRKKILYCSEEENMGTELTVKKMTPAHLYTKKHQGDPYRFIRFRNAFTFQIGLRTITRWFAKQGTAYSKRLEVGDVGEFTLLTVMESVWGKDVITELQDEMKQKLIKSEVMITVRLEDGLTPTKSDGSDYKDMGELFISEEADDKFAGLLGERIRKEISKEDWIRTIALVGCGIALALVAQGMGLIGGFA